jgi:methionyl-tRNA synthetase
MIAADIGADAMRYFVVRETPLGSDGDFSHDGLLQRINAELANDLGNLLNRSLAMACKYCDKQVPAAADDLEAEAVDGALIALATRVRDAAAAHYDGAAPSKALEVIWELVRAGNKYIDTTAPYKLAKDPQNQRRVEEVVYNFLEALRWISMLVAPVMPNKAAEIRRQLGLGEADPSGQLTWPDRWGDLASGLPLDRGKPLFPRIDDDRRAELLGKWRGAANQDDGSKKPEKAAAKAGDGKQQIAYDDFARLDLRVAQIVEAGPVEGADRLLKIKVDIGKEQRQIVAGIAEVYRPEELVGRKVIFLANLKPAKIRGVRSEGTLLAAGGKKVLALSALDRDVPPGTKVS